MFERSEMGSAASDSHLGVCLGAPSTFKVVRMDISKYNLAEHTVSCHHIKWNSYADVEAISISQDGYDYGAVELASTGGHVAGMF